MNKKLLILSILFIGGLFVSCSGDESGETTPTPPVIIAPSPITVSSTSSEFLIAGENLEINGTNFVNKDYPTKIFINDIEVTPKEITNVKILLSSGNAKAGVNTLKIQIDKVSSSPISFFAIAKGWNTLNVLGTADIATSSVFDDSKTIFSFADNDTSENGFWGAPKKLEGKSTGYTQVYINQSGSYGAFQMVTDKIGVLTNSMQSFYSDNGFETNKKTDVTSTFSPEINGLRIGYIDSKNSIITTLIGTQLYTNDNGTTITKNDPPKWARKVGGSIRLSATAFGKSTSDNKFYQLGIIYDIKKYGSNNYKNVVMESPTGYSDWTVKDTISKADLKISYKYKFQNINRIFTLNTTDKTLVESTDMLKTWNVIKTDVSAFFLRSETQWYIQSGDKLFVTKDSGATWEFELELPAGSVVNDISFSKTKIIVSGNKGLHYLKIE